MLSLVTSFYPIVLVVITCILMDLHARNYRLIHIVWKPFSTIFDKLKITSVTGDATFATFILLTTSSIYYNLYNNVREIQNQNATYTILYFDPTIIPSQEHIPYILAAVVPFIILVLIPSLQGFTDIYHGLLVAENDWPLQHLLKLSTAASKMV